jgi:hypothetical protein
VRKIFDGVLDFTLRLRKLSAVEWVIGVRIFFVLQLGAWTLLVRLRRFRSSYDCVSEITEKFVKLLKGIVRPVLDGHLFI